MRRLIIAAAWISIAATPLTGQTDRDTPDRGTMLIRAGRLADAEAWYDSVLAERDDPGARLTRGHVRSWRGHYDDALSDFRRVLADDPTNLSAHIGSGYVAAWRHEYGRARESFERVLRLDPSSREAATGLAYVALWSGHSVEAAARFDSLLETDPADVELALAYGHALRASGRTRSARHAFAQARALDPSHAGARAALEQVRFAPAPVEVALWGGYTRFADGFGGRFGLRLAQLSFGWRPGARFWVRYDNGLSLDNPALATAGADVPSVTGGAVFGWGGRFMTRLEVGWRTLPGGTQRIVAAEQGVAFSSVSVAGGAWVGKHDAGPTEWVLSGHIGVHPAPWLTLDPTIFVSSDGVSDRRALRGLFSATARPGGGTELTLGIAAGRNAVAPGLAAGVSEGFVLASVPVTPVSRFHMGLRHQRIASGTDLTVASLGVTLNLLER